MILYSPESNYAKELRKWEALPSSIGQGERPWVFRPYPAMMYHASSPTAIDAVATAADETEAAQLHARGFSPTPLEALAAHQAQALEYAKLAAEREHDVAYKLSEKAVAEVRAAEAEHSGHMPTMPITPIPPKTGLASWATKKKE